MVRANETKARYERNMQWRKMYEEGMTLREISERTGGDYVGTISRGIQTVGGTMRPTGYPKGKYPGKKKPPKGILAWVKS